MEGAMPAASHPATPSPSHSSQQESAGALLRVSAMPAVHDPFSPDNQRRLCHDDAARNNKHIPPEFEVQELDVSGRKDRPRRGLDDALSLLLTRAGPCGIRQHLLAGGAVASPQPAPRGMEPAAPLRVRRQRERATE